MKIHFVLLSILDKFLTLRKEIEFLFIRLIEILRNFAPDLVDSGVKRGLGNKIRSYLE